MAELKHKYSDEAWQAITKVSCVDVALALGYQIDEKRSDNNALHMADSGGLYVWRNGQGFFRHSTETKGNAVQLVQEELNCKYVEALDFINDNVLNRRFETQKYTREAPIIENQKTEFQLPEFGEPKRAFAYLAKTRGIDAEIISELLKEGKIRQEKAHGNCCFIGHDAEGNARYCATRGTGAVQYRGEISNSDKNYGFVINGKSPVLKVFESPIDAMSHATLTKLAGRDWKEDTRLSLGGCAERALIQHLKDYPGKYKEIWFCLDNDVAGRKAAASLSEKYGKDYTVKTAKPICKDFNEDLTEIKSCMDRYNCNLKTAIGHLKIEQNNQNQITALKDAELEIS